MQMVNQGRNVRVALDKGFGKLDRVRGCVANTFNAGHQIYQVKQLGKVDVFAQIIRPSVGIDVLPQQVDLLHPATRK